MNLNYYLCSTGTIYLMTTALIMDVIKLDEWAGDFIIWNNLAKFPYISLSIHGPSVLNGLVISYKGKSYVHVAFGSDTVVNLL